MKLFLAVLALSTLPAMAADTSAAKVSGYVSDSMCGAKHNGSAPDAACVKKCIGGGAKPVFVDDANKTVYTIDDPDSVRVTRGTTSASSPKWTIPRRPSTSPSFRCSPIRARRPGPRRCTRPFATLDHPRQCLSTLPRFRVFKRLTTQMPWPASIC